MRKDNGERIIAALTRLQHVFEEAGLARPSLVLGAHDDMMRIKQSLDHGSRMFATRTVRGEFSLAGTKLLPPLEQP